MGAARRPDRRVARHGDAAVLLRQHADAFRMIRCELARDRGRAIGGPVVDDDQLPVAKRLRDHRLDGRAEELLAVVGRHDDRNKQADISGTRVGGEDVGHPDRRPILNEPRGRYVVGVFPAATRVRSAGTAGGWWAHSRSR